MFIYVVKFVCGDVFKSPFEEQQFKALVVASWSEHAVKIFPVFTHLIFLVCYAAVEW